MRRLIYRLSAALVFTSMFVNLVHAQQSSPTGAESVASRVEDGVVRELLRKILEEQKSLDEQQKSIDEQQKHLQALIGQLRQLLDRGTARNVSTAGKPIVPSITTGASGPIANAASDTRPEITDQASTTLPQASGVAPQRDDDRYRDGIVIWETGEDAKVPFLLKFNDNTQIRYLNTLDSLTTFTDHLGVEVVLSPSRLKMS